jgi:hypothetical protein
VLLFIDESKQETCEVLAGIAISEENLWNLVKAIRAAEKEFFGDYLRKLRTTEVKAKKLLKKKTFRHAAQKLDIPDDELSLLAKSFLEKGLNAHKESADKSAFTAKEITGYARSVLGFVDKVIDIAAGFDVKVFASIEDKRTAQAEHDLLKKTFVYLFERYFYFLKTLPENTRGLVVFDELEKSEAKKLVQQMASYFLGTQTGEFRSSKIIPEPFFVHSELTTGVFLADLAAYIIGWGWRSNQMTQETREELKPFAQKLHEMQFIGEKPKDDDSGKWNLYGIKYIEDREQNEAEKTQL